jgi:predicted metal-dependent hydrolase
MTTETGRPTPSIPTRRVQLEEAFAEVPRHFAEGNDLLLSHLTVSLSSMFPDGEEFFVRSVRHFRDRIEDPELKRQVAGFIGQESVHGREHRAFNDRMQALGYPAKHFERMTARYLRLRERFLPPIANLAATAALEHFTATLGALVLRDEGVRASFGHPAVSDLFVWHALEETEHKAVAFDVYRVVGGPEWLRIWTMRTMRVLFVAGVVLQMLVSLAQDPGTFQRGRLRASWRHLRTTPLLRRELWEELRRYDRRGFHPREIPTDDLVAQWRQRLFGEGGTMVDKLAGAQAA